MTPEHEPFELVRRRPSAHSLRRSIGESPFQNRPAEGRSRSISNPPQQRHTSTTSVANERATTQASHLGVVKTLGRTLGDLDVVRAALDVVRAVGAACVSDGELCSHDYFYLR